MKSQKKIRIAIADDQPIFRFGFAAMLRENEKYEVLIQAENGKDMLDQLEKTEVDLVFLDFRMPVLNGIETARLIRKKYPDLGVLILSMYDDEEFVVSAIENGANGYLTKDDQRDEIFNAVESVISTGYFINDRTSRILVKKLVHSGKVNPVFKDADTDVKFSDEELQVIKLVSEEHSNKEIAAIMSKSERTIEKYKQSINLKTGTRNTAGIIMYGIRNHLIFP